MPRRRPANTPPKPADTSSFVTVRELDARLEAVKADIKADIKWIRWVMMALAAAVASPKVSGPSAPDATTALLHAIQNLT